MFHFPHRFRLWHCPAAPGWGHGMAGRPRRVSLPCTHVHSTLLWKLMNSGASAHRRPLVHRGSPPAAVALNDGTARGQRGRQDRPPACLCAGRGGRRTLLCPEDTRRASLGLLLHAHARRQGHPGSVRLSSVPDVRREARGGSGRGDPRCG